MRRWMIVAAALLSLGGLSACSSGKCEPCTTCPDFTGEYYEIIKLVIDNCDNVELIEGDLRLRVFNQLDTTLDIEMTDRYGTWAVLSGYLCETNETDYPKDYAFSASYSPSQAGDRVILDYLLSGYFHLESDQAPAVLNGTLSITEHDLDSRKTCQVSGSISPKITQ